MTEHHPILMLVPHEPDQDPRIGWVMGLCAKMSRVDVVGIYQQTSKPEVSYDGNVVIQRCILTTKRPFIFRLLKPNLWPLKARLIVLRWRMKVWWEHPTLPFSLERLPRFIIKVFRSPRKALIGSTQFRRSLRLAVRMSGMGGDLLASIENEANALLALARNEIESTEVKKSRNESLPNQTTKRNIFRFLLCTSIHHFLTQLQLMSLLSKTLYERSRSVSLVPSVVICHDIYGLLVGVKLKKLFACPVLYDSHEFWPSAFLDAHKWETRVIAFLEGRAIRHADAVITVTPQIAQELKNLYGIDRVVTVPNAEPFIDNPDRSCNRPIRYPIKLLLQGHMRPRRGIEEFLDGWTSLADDRAIVILRCPEGEYLLYLKRKYERTIHEGRLVVASPVSETELVSAASSADVGVIPYPGPNLNHVYACPNKLSQYMQAGLAILCNSDMVFVSGLLREQQCGITYKTGEPSSLIEAIMSLIKEPDQLQLMKGRAYQYALSHFNWEIQSQVYKDTIIDLIERGH